MSILLALPMVARSRSLCSPTIAKQGVAHVMDRSIHRESVCSPQLPGIPVPACKNPDRAAMSASVAYPSDTISLAESPSTVRKPKAFSEESSGANNRLHTALTQWVASQLRVQRSETLPSAADLSKVVLATALWAIVSRRQMSKDVPAVQAPIMLICTYLCSQLPGRSRDRVPDYDTRHR